MRLPQVEQRGKGISSLRGDVDPELVAVGVAHLADHRARVHFLASDDHGAVAQFILDGQLLNLAVEFLKGDLVNQCSGKKQEGTHSSH